MKYQNPIIRGFNPDPSICRVGRDYYLVTSTFEYFPGIPVYHSNDLVNWKLIGHCISRLQQLPKLNEAVTARGIWAPTIRYHEGVFYVTATCFGVGNFIVSTTDPAGEWSDPVYVPIDGIDPSIYFEDKRAYYCTNQNGGSDNVQGLSLVEIDISTGQLLSDVKFVWAGTGGAYAEAPHIYKVGDWYYAMMAEGGTFYMHMVTIARSKNIWGPYEACPHNPILTNRHDQSRDIACSGHADLIEDADGNWWMVHLGTRSVVNWNSQLGRESFLMPFTWENGWPKVAGAAMSLLEADGPLTAEQKMPDFWKADFSVREPEWIHLRLPKEENYSWNAEGVTLVPSTDKFSDPLGNPTFIAVRQYDMESSFEALLDFVPETDGDEAGITTYLTDKYYYKMGKCRDNGKNYLVVQKAAEDFFQEVYRQEILDGEVKCYVRAQKEFYDFYYSINGQEMIHAAHISSHMLSWDFALTFTGTVFGVYAQCEQQTDAKALLKAFEMHRF